MDQQTQLESLEDSHFEAAKSLQSVTDDMENCMKRILKCMPIILWLREELKGDCFPVTALSKNFMAAFSLFSLHH